MERVCWLGFLCGTESGQPERIGTARVAAGPSREQRLILNYGLGLGSRIFPAISDAGGNLAAGVVFFLAHFSAHGTERGVEIDLDTRPRVRYLPDLFSRHFSVPSEFAFLN